MPEPFTLLACKLDLPIPTQAWLQYHKPLTKQDLCVGAAICVFTADATTEGPTGLINGVVEVSPCWVAFTGWDDEMRTSFLLLVPRKWIKHPPSRRGFLTLHPKHPSATDFPIPVTSLDRIMQMAILEQAERTHKLRGEQQKWAGLGGVRVVVETQVVNTATVS